MVGKCDDGECRERIVELERALGDVLVMVNSLRGDNGRLPLGFNELYRKSLLVLRGRASQVATQSSDEPRSSP